MAENPRTHPNFMSTTKSEMLLLLLPIVSLEAMRTVALLTTRMKLIGNRTTLIGVSVTISSSANNSRNAGDAMTVISNAPPNPTTRTLPSCRNRLVGTTQMNTMEVTASGTNSPSCDAFERANNCYLFFFFFFVTSFFAV